MDFCFLLRFGDAVVGFDLVLGFDVGFVLLWLLMISG